MTSSFDRRTLLARLVALAAAPLLPASPARSGLGSRMLVRGPAGAGALNRSGAIIWLGLVRGVPETEIAAAIAGESGDTVEEALEVVRRFGRELVLKGILDEREGTGRTSGAAGATAQEAALPTSDGGDGSPPPAPAEPVGM